MGQTADRQDVSGMFGCEDSAKNSEDVRDVCSCGQPYTLQKFKKKVRVKNTKGVKMMISKNETRLGCSGCSEPSSSQVQEDRSQPSKSISRKGGGLRQMRLSDYFRKQT